MKLPFQGLTMLEGDIISLDLATKSVTIRYKMPRRPKRAERTVVPFAIVVGEEGGVGQVAFFESASTEFDGEIESVENGVVVADLEGGVKGYFNSEVLATVTSYIDKVDEEDGGDKKSKKKDKKAAKADKPEKGGKIGKEGKKKKKKK